MSVTEGTILRVVQTINMPGNEIAQNVYHFSITGGSAPYDAEDVVSDCIDEMDDLYTVSAGLMTTSVDGGLVQIYEYDSVDDDWDEVGFGAAGWAGSGSAETLPHGVAGIFSGLTTDPDVRGRKFWPGLGEDKQEEGALTSAALALLASVAVYYVTGHVGALTGATLNPGVWSTVQTNFRAFLGASIVNSILGYQRRRKPGVGA